MMLNITRETTAGAKNRLLTFLCVVGAAVLAASSPTRAAGDDVRLESSSETSFKVTTGQYSVSYAPLEESAGEGWITIKRDGFAKPGIATCLANGINLDVTKSGTGEGAAYGWKLPRKDHRIFKSLDCKESDETIVVTIHSQRRWATFTSVLTFWKHQPGLVNWTVTANTVADKALSGEVEPDCHFTFGDQGYRPGAAHHSVIPYMTQRGPASGIAYFADVNMGSFVFYFEDYSSLNTLYKLTGCDNPFDYTAPGNPGAVKIGTARSTFQLASSDGTNVSPAKPWVHTPEYQSKFG